MLETWAEIGECLRRNDSTFKLCSSLSLGLRQLSKLEHLVRNAA
jgi:hypothetical protein